MSEKGKRLTNGSGSLVGCTKCKHNDCVRDIDCNAITKALIKLQQYEDMEEKQEFIVPPCKIGDTFYEIVGDGFGEPHIQEKRIVEYELRINNHYVVGNTVFLSKEEAEKALASIKNNLSVRDALRTIKICIENEILFAGKDLTRSYAYQRALDIVKNEFERVGFTL